MGHEPQGAIGPASRLCQASVGNNNAAGSTHLSLACGTWDVEEPKVVHTMSGRPLPSRIGNMMLRDRRLWAKYVNENGHLCVPVKAKLVKYSSCGEKIEEIPQQGPCAIK